MKRLNGLLAGTFIALTLGACSSESINTVQPIAQENQQVVAQSVKGLNSFYNTIVDRTFAFLDKNKDKSVSFDEYMSRNSAGALPPGIQPQDVAVERVPGGSPVDTKNLFIKVDKNKNGRLTLTEARNSSRDFLGVNKTQIRQLVAKSMFSLYNKNVDKYISKEEFLSASSNIDTKSASLLSSLFYSSDKNGDKRLTFSEFEDYSYAMIQAMWDSQATQPVPTQPSQPVTSDPGTVPPSNTPDQPVSSNPDQPVSNDPGDTTQPDDPSLPEPSTPSNNDDQPVSGAPVDNTTEPDEF